MRMLRTACVAGRWAVELVLIPGGWVSGAGVSQIRVIALGHSDQAGGRKPEGY